MAAVPESAEPLYKDDRQLQQAVLSLGEKMSAGAKPENFLRQVDRHVEAGACLDTAQVLHCAAANNLHPVVLTGLFERGAVINHLNFEGMTALIVAAKLVANNASRHERWDTSLLKCLLDLGADKELVDKQGKTALGHICSANLQNNDFLVYFGHMKQMAPVNLHCERLLVYPGELTPGDEEAAREGQYKDEAQLWEAEQV